MWVFRPSPTLINIHSHLVDMKPHPISVVVITRNEERNIADCLRSINDLDYDNFETIVVDNSSDRTPEISRGLGARVFRMEESNFAASRNIGIRESKHEIVAFTDADCTVPRNWLKKLAPFIEGDVAGAGGSAYPPPGSPHVGACIAALGFPAGGSLGIEAIGRNISTANAIFKKSALEEIGGFDESLSSGGEDADLCMRLRKSGYGIVQVPGSYVYHKVRRGGSFISWCIRRGKAKFHLKRSVLDVLMPLKIFPYIASRKYRMLWERRRKTGMDIFSVVVVVPVLFFMRQLFMLVGWLIGITKCC